LVFVSHGALTVDDTRTEGPAQVYEYDSQTGGLVRVSKGQDGLNDNGNAGVGGASIVPVRIGSQMGSVRSDPSMSDDGQFVFFQSPVGLTGEALDDRSVEGHPGVLAENVYEYHAGRVSLISDGHDRSAYNGHSGVELLGSDGSGANVFFTAANSLVVGDSNTEVDFYDARVCSGGEPCVVTSPAGEGCVGEGCRGVGATLAPSLPVPATVSFGEGAGASAPAAGTVVAGRSVLRVAGGVLVHGSRFGLAVRVLGRGVITVSGAGVSSVRRSVVAGGLYMIHVVLSRREKGLLARKGLLRLALHVGFTPAGGSVAGSVVKVTVKR
jgi:hypothetical protein